MKHISRIIPLISLIILLLMTQTACDLMAGSKDEASDNTIIADETPTEEPIENEPVVEPQPPDYSAYRKMVTVPTGTIYHQSIIGSASPPDYGFYHTVSSFELGAYEVTYEFWYEVYSWASKNGYVFLNAGREGYDGTPGAQPTEALLEPVTYVSALDALIWCNALSEKEGLEPVYYVMVDEEYDNIPLEDYVRQVYRDILWTSGVLNEIFVDYQADGYRLPTTGEWLYAASYPADGEKRTAPDYAAGDNQPINDSENQITYRDYAWYSYNSGALGQVDKSTVDWGDLHPNFRVHTHPVGTKLPTGLGLYDMTGNVREIVGDTDPVLYLWSDGPTTDIRPEYLEKAQFKLRGGGCSDWESLLKIGLVRTISFRDADRVNGFRIARSVL